MQKGEAYRTNYKRLAGEKLVIPRDKDGSPILTRNSERQPEGVLKLLRTIQSELSQYPQFVAVVAHGGSLLHGYSHEASDLDLHVLYDAPETSEKAAFGELADALWKVQPKKPEEGRMLDASAMNINIVLWRRMFEDGKRDMAYMLDPIYKVPAALADVALSKHDASGASTISVYRNEIASYLAMRSAEEQETFRNSLVKFLVFQDTESWHKIAKRIPEASSEEYSKEEFALQRKQVWGKRVDNVFGLGSRL